MCHISKILGLFGVLCISLFILVGCISTPDKAGNVVAVNSEKFRQVGTNVFSGGQPTQHEFSKLKSKGIKTVISLRPASELEWNQREYLSELGINYINLPIQGASGISKENAETLMSMIDQYNGEPLLVHCGSGNRVGALIATAEHTVNNKDIEMSIKVGKEWGLTGLEPRVREILTAPNAQPE